MSRSAACSIGREGRVWWRNVVFFKDDIPQALKNVLVMAKGCRDRLEVLQHIDRPPEQESHSHGWII